MVLEATILSLCGVIVILFHATDYRMGSGNEMKCCSFVQLESSLTSAKLLNALVLQEA